jgi:hypothetical protein
MNGMRVKGFKEVGSYELVDGCQGQGILEKSSSGSRGSYWAVALIMMMTLREYLYVLFRALLSENF